MSESRIPSQFRVGVSPDVGGPDGKPVLDLGLRLLDEVEGVSWELMEGTGGPLESDQIRGFDALLLADASVVSETLPGADRLGHIARLGVGFEDLDLDGCTQRGIVITNAPDGVRRPMAVSAMLLILALAQRLVVKDRLTRSGRWDDRWDYLGTGVTGLTIGLIGAGNIGQEICRLAASFDLRTIVFDPYIDAQTAAEVGFELLDLETVMREADFVCVSCPLNDETWHLISSEQFALMKPTAYLINVARGPIVDEAALLAALQSGQIQGAGLDVFEQEPVAPDNPLLELENVILAPHAIGHTDELFRRCGESGCRGMLMLARGEIPPHVVNKAVLDHPRVVESLRAPRLKDAPRLRGGGS